MMSSNTRYRAVHADDCRSYSAYIGLDVHKETITISVAYNGRKDPEHLGEIPNNPESARKLVARLNKQFACELLLFCYEAGPCGYVLYRQLLDLGHHCMVVAPSRIPKIPGERVKTDRRGASKLARMLRRGDLTPVWVADKRQEAMRDLVRLREDVKDRERKVRQQLNNYSERVSEEDFRGRARRLRYSPRSAPWFPQERRICPEVQVGPFFPNIRLIAQ